VADISQLERALVNADAAGDVEAASQLAGEIRRLRSAPAAQTPPSGFPKKIGKEAFYAAADMTFEQALDFLAEKLGEVAFTQDAVEGITAFIEKREPVFTGK